MPSEPEPESGGSGGGVGSGGGFPPCPPFPPSEGVCVGSCVFELSPPPPPFWSQSCPPPNVGWLASLGDCASFESFVPLPLLPLPNASSRDGAEPSGLFLVLIPLFPPPPAPFLGAIRFLIWFITAAPPAALATAPNAPAVLAFSNPKNLRSIFSAGVINANATIANNGFLAAKSIADPTKIL